MLVEPIDEKLPPALRRLHEAGVAHLPGYLDATLRRLPLASAEKWPFEVAEEHFNGVLQRFRHAKQSPITEGGPFSWFVRGFARGVQEFEATALWEPNEASFQMYEAGEGIGWHRDFSRCRYLIAIFNLRGTATFRTQKESMGWVHGASFKLEPGDLVLMRADGFGRSIDYRRPRHSVTDCSPGRTSLTLRMMSA